jgi:lysyl-tRNA synthetase class 2
VAGARRAVSARQERQGAVVAAVYAVATLAALSVWSTRRWDADGVTWVETVFGVLNVPVSQSLVSVSLLALTTLALLGRKRAGLLVVAAAQVLGTAYAAAAAALRAQMPHNDWVSHDGFSQDLDVVSVLVGVAALAWLWRLRGAFSARLRPGSWLRAGAVLAAGLLASVAATWLLLVLVTPSREAVRWQFVGAALGRSLGDPDLIARRSLVDVPTWLPQVTSVLVSLTLLTAVWEFLRSARNQDAWSAERELTIRRLLATYDGADSLGYFATRRDKSSVLSRHGDAVLTYRVLNGVSLASGDPVGDPRHWEEVIGEWKAQARRFGWIPAVLSASETGAQAYAAAGLGPVRMGDEAVLDPDRFSLDRPAMTPVRHAAKRARRAGVHVTFQRQAAIGPEELAELLSAAARWRGDEPDRGFSMALNRPGDPADPDVLHAVARDGGGALQAVLSFVPWGRAGVSLDVMRRRPDAPNGVVELMVAELMRAAPVLGVRRVSLNFCMFRTVYAEAARLGAGPLTRLNYTVLGRLDRFWQLERLYRSNQKYDPEWRPRYLCCDSWVALPLVLVAAGVAEGFLPRGWSSTTDRPGSLDAEELEEARALGTRTVPGPGPRHGDQERARLRGAAALRELGMEPWPVGCPSTDHLTRLGPGLPALGEPVRVVARVASIRDHGGVVFAVLAVPSGLTDGRWRLQAVLETRSPEAQARRFARLVDPGDLVLVDGVSGTSRSGEPSLLVARWTMLAKSLRPLRFDAAPAAARQRRERVTDLIVRPGAAELLRHRAAVVRSLREILEADGYLEVETPVLNPVHGGASARPFRTWSNAYGMDLCLRIAPELHLKRLVVAGLGPLFEIGRNFRNEGADASHNPEFTALEAYRPFADYGDMRRLTERLVRAAMVAVHGAEVLPLQGADRLVPMPASFVVVPFLDAVSDAVGTRVDLDMDFDRALGIARTHGIRPRGDMGVGALLEALYADLVEPSTSEPTFYVDFPLETSPLVRRHRSLPGLVERWDLVVGGVEIATAYSELTDPVDQRQRLVAQSHRAAAGDLEAMEVDEAFLSDLELGMPPTGGLGVGVDRLVMVVAGVPIREVLAFPFARPPTGR